MSDVEAMGLAMLAARDALYDAREVLEDQADEMRSLGMHLDRRVRAMNKEIRALTAAIDAAGIERPKEGKE